MITEQDLQEAIAECEGQRNPNANTCIKLAAFYTIRNNMFPKTDAQTPEPLLPHSYSFMADTSTNVEAETKTVMIDSDTDFAKAVNKLPQSTTWGIMNELMSTLAVLNPKLYASVMRKIEAAE